MPLAAVTDEVIIKLNIRTDTQKHGGKRVIFSNFLSFVAGTTYLWASCSIFTDHERNNCLLSLCQHGAEKHLLSPKKIK